MHTYICSVIAVNLIILSFLVSPSYQRCGVHEYKHDPSIDRKIDLGIDKERFLQTNDWAPIRIYADYSYLETQSSLVEKGAIDNIKTVVDKVVSFYSNLVSVRRLTKPLLLPNCQDEEIKFSDAVTKTGVSADLVIGTYIDSKFGESTEAAATFCFVEKETGRPLLGIIGFNKRISFAKKNSIFYNSLLTLHEVNHIISFHDNLFPNFIDSNGNKIPLEKTVQKQIINGLERKLISSPKVLEAAKKYFGCDSMIGVELENQGEAGSLGNHWEMRTMAGDFMISESYDETFISSMSIALMEDSGWYKVNYYTGGLFRYGKGKGCGFLNTKCVKDGKTNFPNEFELTENKMGCFAGRTTRGLSSLQQLTSVDPNYQYFSNKSQAGNMFSDYCPLIIGIRNDDFFLTGSCSCGYSNIPSSMGEVIGAYSNCFISSLTPQNDNSVNMYKGIEQGICYPITCDSTSKTITVKIVNQTVQCPPQGGSITVNGFDGNLQCPDYNLICNQSVPCVDAFDCASKKSLELSASVLPSITPISSPTSSDPGSTTVTPSPDSTTTSAVTPSSSLTASYLTFLSAYSITIMFILF
jgi:leishmanolysin